jgi:hypothetical protein
VQPYKLAVANLTWTRSQADVELGIDEPSWTS